MKIRLYAQPPWSGLHARRGGSARGRRHRRGPASRASVRLRTIKPTSPASGPRGRGPSHWMLRTSRNSAGCARRYVSSHSGTPSPAEVVGPVELALSSGQAEARLNWWMQAPTEWTATQALVTLLMELSLRERSADLDPEDAYVDDRGQGGDVDEQVDFGSAASPRPGRRKKGLFGKLLGG